MKSLHLIAFILLIIGGLNWLLTGVFVGWDIGKFLGGEGTLIPRVIYILIGIAAVLEVATHKSLCKNCEKKGGMAGINPQ